MSCQDTLQNLPPVPVSVQTILCQLYGHTPMTGKQLREATGLPRRTIYTALSKLRDLGLLQERQSLRDTRQTYFWVPAPAGGAAAPARPAQASPPLTA
ncbi:MAG: Sugar-specific transcriptional regulator TrmB [Thermoplasmata archaeon]|jgi:DNA-binding MarR family transcriptional regulator|nr:Sugar-specific transcriptional regulator TrmB [Thermoplasmata archaeon]